MTADVVVALIGLIGSVLVQFGGILINSKLTNYRLEQLENKVNMHNNAIERIYRLEQADAVHNEQMAVANHRLADIEKKVG